MSYNYKNLEEFERDFAFLFGGSPRDLRLFIIGEDKQARLKARQLVKKVLEEVLDSAKKEKEIKNYRVRMVDLTTKSGQIFVERCQYRKVGINKHDFVIVPIIESADESSHLPQFFFDKILPVVFCVSQNGYNAVNNHSKRDCYDTLKVK